MIQYCAPTGLERLRGLADRALPCLDLFRLYEAPVNAKYRPAEESTTVTNKATGLTYSKNLTCITIFTKFQISLYLHQNAFYL